jgi:hypothetical protein
VATLVDTIEFLSTPQSEGPGFFARMYAEEKIEPDPSDYWIGVDFDGTLVKQEKFPAIGKPVEKMVRRVKKWLTSGCKVKGIPQLVRHVKVFTARAGDPKQRKLVSDWTQKYLGQRLEVTNKKTPTCVRIVDNISVRVKQDTGELMGGGPGSGRHPSGNAPQVKVKWAKADKGWNPELVRPAKVAVKDIGMYEKGQSKKIVADYVQKMTAGQKIQRIWVEEAGEGKYRIASGTFGGHHRLLALKQLGYSDEKIPVYEHAVAGASFHAGKEPYSTFNELRKKIQGKKAFKPLLPDEERQIREQASSDESLVANRVKQGRLLDYTESELAEMMVESRLQDYETVDKADRKMKVKLEAGGPGSGRHPNVWGGIKKEQELVKAYLSKLPQRAHDESRVTGIRLATKGIDNPTYFSGRVASEYSNGTIILYPGWSKNALYHEFGHGQNWKVQDDYHKSKGGKAVGGYGTDESAKAEDFANTFSSHMRGFGSPKSWMSKTYGHVMHAGGPGSGRKPSWSRKSLHPDKLDRMHNRLVEKGFSYRYSGDSDNGRDHVYIKGDPTKSGRAIATIHEDRDGYHSREIIKAGVSGPDDGTITTKFPRSKESVYTPAEQRDVRAGGYGSGRHPYAAAHIADVLSHHGFEKTGNTVSGKSIYRNDSNDYVVVDHHSGIWMHKEKTSGAKDSGSGMKKLDSHLSRAYGEDKFSVHEEEIRQMKPRSVYAGGPGSGRHPYGKKVANNKGWRVDPRRSQAGKVNPVRIALAEQNYAEHKIQNMVAKAVGGKVYGRDSEPVDVVVRDAKGKLHGIEVKGVLLKGNNAHTAKGKSQQVYMGHGAVGRKYAWANANGAKLHTVIVDVRSSRTNPDVYHANKVGSLTFSKSVGTRGLKPAASLVSGGFKGLRSAVLG